MFWVLIIVHNIENIIRILYFVEQITSIVTHQNLEIG